MNSAHGSPAGRAAHLTDGWDPDIVFEASGGRNVAAGLFVVLYRPSVDPPAGLAGYRRIEHWSELAGLLDVAG